MIITKKLKNVYIDKINMTLETFEMKINENKSYVLVCAIKSQNIVVQAYLDNRVKELVLLLLNFYQT